MLRNVIRFLPFLCVCMVLLSAELWADEPVTWTSMVNSSSSGGSLTKTAATTAYDAGASSTQLIRDGYGYVEFTVTALNKEFTCGLSNGDTNQAATDVDFGLLINDSGLYRVYEAGVSRGYF